MSYLESSVDGVGKLIERGLREELYAIVKRHLLESIDEIIVGMAREIADNIVVNAESFTNPADRSFGPSTQVVINLNLKGPPIKYDSKTGKTTVADIISR